VSSVRRMEKLNQSERSLTQFSATKKQTLSDNIHVDHQRISLSSIDLLKNDLQVSQIEGKEESYSEEMKAKDMDWTEETHIPLSSQTSTSSLPNILRKPVSMSRFDSVDHSKLWLGHKVSSIRRMDKLNLSERSLTQFSATKKQSLSDNFHVDHQRISPDLLKNDLQVSEIEGKEESYSEEMKAKDMEWTEETNITLSSQGPDFNEKKDNIMTYREDGASKEAINHQSNSSISSVPIALIPRSTSAYSIAYNPWAALSKNEQNYKKDYKDLEIYQYGYDDPNLLVEIGKELDYVSEDDDNILNLQGESEIVDYSFLIFGTDANDLSAQPHVMSPPLMESLQTFFPFVVSEDNFWLKYSLVRDGASISTLLSKLKGPSRTLIAIETTEGEVFGSFTSASWHCNGSAYFGRGESFLWRLRRPRDTPCASITECAKIESEVKVYPFTGANSHEQLW